MGVILVREEIEVRRGRGKVGDDVVVLRRGLGLSARRRGSHRTMMLRVRSSPLTESQEASRSSYSCWAFSYSPRRYLWPRS